MQVRNEVWEKPYLMITYADKLCRPLTIALNLKQYLVFNYSFPNAVDFILSDILLNELS